MLFATQTRGNAAQWAHLILSWHNSVRLPAELSQDLVWCSGSLSSIPPSVYRNETLRRAQGSRRGRATQSTCKHTSATFIRKFTGKIPMPLQSHTNDIKNNTRKSATLYANLQVKTRRQEKAAQATSKKQHVKTPFYTVIYRKKCRYQQKSGTSDTKKSGTSDAKKSGTSERLTIQMFETTNENILYKTVDYPIRGIKLFNMFFRHQQWG